MKALRFFELLYAGLIGFEIGFIIDLTRTLLR
jgi:hypothetical protein